MSDRDSKGPHTHMVTTGRMDTEVHCWSHSRGQVDFGQDPTRWLVDITEREGYNEKLCTLK